MMRWFLIFSIVIVAAVFGHAAQAKKAEPLTIDLAEDYVDITTGFDGAHLVVFGTKKRRGDLAVVLRGPEKKAIVRKKNNVAGVWMNTQSFRFRDVPSYYDFALNVESIERIQKKNLPLLPAHKIGIDPAYFEYKNPDAEGLETFQKALLRNKQREGVYPTKAKAITFISDDLFKAEFYLPASVPKGEYEIVTYLMDRGRMIDQKETTILVKQVGLSSFVNRFAYDKSLAYGVLCVIFAMFSGWGINALRQGF